jgi:hypothetical protein
MRTVWLAAVAITAFSMQGQAQFFPKSSLDSRGDDFKAKWYSNQLHALREPSLFAFANKGDAESYRFLWLRTFHHPIAVRVDHLQSDGSWLLITKVASGAGGYSPGTLTTNTSRKLTAQEAQSLVSRVESGRFWNAPNPVNDQTGTDGSQWIIEGVKAGRYHVVDRWMPKNGPARELGLFLAFDLAGLSIPKNEIY